MDEKQAQRVLGKMANLLGEEGLNGKESLHISIMWFVTIMKIMRLEEEVAFELIDTAKSYYMKYLKEFKNG